MINDNQSNLRSDCENCFGLCCVALPYSKSTDFAYDKDGGSPCENLQIDYRCKIHQDLRSKGFRGCTIYECFGAGQKVSQNTYKGMNWRDNPELAEEMFDVFPIMQQLHEMLCYLNEALSLEDTKPIHKEIKKLVEETEPLTNLNPVSILSIDIHSHRSEVNGLLLKTSELVRANVEQYNNQSKKIKRRSDLVGANLRGANLRGLNLRGSLLIAADLREANLQFADFIGADMRDADLRGANLIGSIFLTQAQVNSAIGDINTKLPSSLDIPEHWLS
ncbi:pentapeptide repeat-containing protein [Caldalkalibacillus salinus]|uniref:pentapeptide repeat-containing protein n=1 Tax=Caldalkalibacillus salinus TaxID=2803787 RepID=UPI001920E0DB